MLLKLLLMLSLLLTGCKQPETGAPQPSPSSSVTAEPSPSPTPPVEGSPAIQVEEPASTTDVAPLEGVQPVPPLSESPLTDDTTIEAPAPDDFEVVIEFDEPDSPSRLDPPAWKGSRDSTREDS